MKNKILILLTAVLLGMIIAAQFVSKNHILYSLKFNKSHNTLNDEMSHFAVENIDDVDKIMIADKTNQKIILCKTDSGWTVNSKYNAREDAIENLLQVIQRIRVKHPISKAEHNLQVSLLATKSKKVEIYKKGELFKTYYVGGSTQDQMGTYTLMEGASAPFVTHIPGFTGFLTPRFIVSESLWRENFVVKAPFESLVSVEVINSEDSKRTFKIVKNDNRTYQLFNKDGKLMGEPDSVFAKTYFNTFKKVSYEAMVVDMKQEKLDSLRAAKPLHTIRVTTKKGTQDIKTFYVKNDNYFNDEGEILKYDPDRMYCLFNGDKEVATVQYFTFNKITIDPNWLMK